MQAEQTNPSSESQCPFTNAKKVITGTGNGKRPPLVKAPPFIGPIKQFTGDVLPFLHETRKTYGDAFRMRMFGHEMTCLCGHDAIALLQEDGVLTTGQSMNVLDKEMNSCLPGAFNGPEHKMYRKIHTQYLNRTLSATKRDEIIGCMGKHLDNWQPGYEFDALDEAQTQTVDVLSVILNGEHFPFTKSELAVVVHTLIFATYGNAPKWLVFNNPKYKSAKKKMHVHLMSLVAKIRKDPELIANTLVGQYLEHLPEDVVEKLNDNDLVAVPIAAYLAGYDTVASAASFLLYNLLSNPDYLAKVRQEYQELSGESTNGHVDPIKQKLLRAAFQETVRLNPPGALVIRYADVDFEFAGCSIRKGDEIVVQISADHLDEELFPEPHKFDPTRFLSDDTTNFKRHILPFGSGAHRCTGAVVGQLFAQEMVSYWVNHFDLELVQKNVKPKVVARPFTQPIGLKVKVNGPL